MRERERDCLVTFKLINIEVNVNDFVNEGDGGILFEFLKKFKPTVKNHIL